MLRAHWKNIFQSYFTWKESSSCSPGSPSRENHQGCTPKAHSWTELIMLERLIWSQARGIQGPMTPMWQRPMQETPAIAEQNNSAFLHCYIDLNALQQQAWLEWQCSLSRHQALTDLRQHVDDFNWHLMWHMDIFGRSVNTLPQLSQYFNLATAFALK